MESMKSVSDCPVCKVPFRRREIRPAPHMDNLVTVFKNMEAAAGINIFTTQQAPSTTQPGNNENEEDKEEKSASHGKSRERKAVSKRKQKLEKQVMPSFPAKKRVHVTPFPTTETPIRPKRILKENKISEKSLNDDKTINKDECNDTTLSPFFWLREGTQNDDNVNETSSRSSGQLIEDTTQSEYVPSFSQMKDSEDEKSPIRKTTTSQFNVEDALDSEMFEWTQRACSPELCSTPTKKQAACKNKLDATQGTKIVLNNEISQTDSAKSGKMGPRNKKFSRKKGKSTKNKRSEKTRVNTLNKCIEVAHGDSPNEAQAKISVDPKEIVKDSFEEELDDPQMVLQSCVREHSKKVKKPRNIGIKNNNAITEGNNLLTNETPNIEIAEIRKKRGKPSNVGQKNINVITEAKKLLTNKAANIEITETGKRSGNFLNQYKKKCKKLSVDSAITALTDNDLRSLEIQTHENNSADKSPSVHESGIDIHTDAFSEPKEKGKRKHIALEAAHDVASTSLEPCRGNLTGKSLTNSGTLKSCGKLRSQIICAFCQRSDDSTDSGEMMHYFNGKPVEANYNEGVNVIHSHKHCTEWAPDVYFEDDMALNLSNEITRSRRIKCSCCSTKGAALGCFEKSCRKSFHFTCAKLIPECRWDDDNFVMLCPAHSSSKFPIKSSEVLKQRRKRNTPKLELKTAVNFNSEGDMNQKWMWPSGSPCKWVLCCSGLTAMEKDVMSEFTKLTGIPINKMWSPLVTHVIASTNENGACKRTLKFLMAVLEGKWILGIEWVKSCLKTMQPVLEEQYEIQKDVHGISGGPKLGRLRALNKEPKLFEHIEFYFAGEFNPSYKGYIQDLINAAGGKILQRKPLKKDEEELFNRNLVSETIIIYSTESPKNEKVNKLEAKGIGNSCRAKAVSSSWILDSIAACKWQPLS